MKDNLLEKIYHSYHAQVFGFALKHIKSEALANDIVQEVFLVLCQKDLETVQNIRSFIFQITRNKVADHFRKSMKNEKMRQAMWTYIEAKQYQSNDSLIAQEMDQIWEKAMDQLTPQQKIIFKLSREEGMTYPMIAEKLQLSKNTVKNHMIGALKTLKSHITPQSDIIIFICLGLSNILNF